MDFGLTTMFVVPPSNSLPTSGNKAALTGTRFGVFLDTYAAATTGNIGAAPYIYLAQNRTTAIPGLGTKTSDKIYKANVIEAYKVLAKTSANVQVTHVTGFTAGCGEQVSVTVRLFSRYIDMGFYNGLTRTVTINTPCCDCGADPCTDVDVEALVDAFVAAINAEALLSQFVTATKSGSGGSAILVLTGKALTVYGTRCDPTAFPFEYDRMRFDTFAYKGPETTQDNYATDACDTFATATITQESNYAHGGSDEIRLLERRFASYQTTFKDEFMNNNFNNAVESNVVAGTFYDVLYLRFYTPKNGAFNDEAAQESRLIIAIPTGEQAATITLLETFLGSGAFVNKTGA